MSGIIESIDVSHVGRPRNNIKFCKVCGIELSFENTRETRKGSGSLRSTCKACERQKDRTRKKAQYHKAHRCRVSRGPAFTEWPNRVGMAAQTGRTEIIYSPDKDPRQIIVYDDTHCKECGGIIRYDERLERVCSECGLTDDVPNIYDAPNGQFTGRQLKSYEKSRYRLRININRDKEFDIQDADNTHVNRDGSYEPTISTGHHDIYYEEAYSKVLKSGKGPKNKRKRTKKEILEDDDSSYPIDKHYGSQIKGLLRKYAY